MLGMIKDAALAQKITSPPIEVKEGILNVLRAALVLTSIVPARDCNDGKEAKVRTIVLTRLRSPAIVERACVFTI